MQCLALPRRPLSPCQQHAPTCVVDLLNVREAAVDEDEGHGEAGHVRDDQRAQQVLEAGLEGREAGTWPK